MDSIDRRYSSQYQQRRDYRRRTRSPRNRWRSRSPSRPETDGFHGHHERERRRPRRSSWEPRRDEGQNSNPSLGSSAPSQAGNIPMTLGESSSEGNVTDGSTPLTSVSPSSHDTSRARFHHPDLKVFAKDLNDAAKAAYPNGPKLGRNRYRTVHVCLIRWTDATEFEQEIDDLDKVFQEYGFTTTKWLLQNTNSYRDLMRKTLDFIESADDPENLFVLYYAGHGRMNTARQAEWISHVGPNTPSLDWSGIQNLFAGIKSEVLILLDTCAAASSASCSQFGVMEVIAACGFESRAAPPGDFSFTRALIDILRDWIGKESFSIATLHTEIFCQLKRNGDKRGREGTKLEWCSSPIYLRYTQDVRTPGIELYRKSQSPLPESVAVNSNRPTTYTNATELDLGRSHCRNSPFYSLSDNKYRIPRVLISVSLEEDQTPLDSERCSRWFADVPFFATDIEVFPSYSKLMIMSVPLPVWNMFPSHPACSFIGYVTGPRIEHKFPFKLQSVEQKVECPLDDQTSQLKEETSPKLERSNIPSQDTMIKPEPREYSPPSRDVPSEWDHSDTTHVEVPSLKEAEEARAIARTNQLSRDWCVSIGEWLSRDHDYDEEKLESGTYFTQSVSPFGKMDAVDIDVSPVDSGVDDDRGSRRENKVSDGETYYDTSKLTMPLNEADLALIVRRQWLAAPTVLERTSTTYQPLTSNDAIMEFNRETDALSICSRAASWGTTRRNSAPSIIAEIEPNPASGGFLKRLLSKKSARETNQSIFDLGLDRLAKFTRKRADSRLKRKSPLESSPDPIPSSTRTGSTTHGNENSAYSTSSLPSVEGLFGSKSQTADTDLEPRTKATWATHPIRDQDSAIGQASTPPTSVREGDKTDNDESDSDEGIDVEVYAPVSSPEPITPNYEGFKAHVRRLNPDMDPRYNWLVSRIAHQQEIRYKSLLELRVRHGQDIQNRSCSSGNKCLALGGSVIQLDKRGNGMQEESRSNNQTRQFPKSDDEDSNPGEGSITQETFPSGIPLPPTRSLPAEFECQLCFRIKRFIKPTDWTKHVHEDVQPFTCTFDKCKEPKSFKRKADWVRHENERHRHLEWWICQVDDCRHPCYRKDNFLQHLVREHKLPEPKQKTKGAIKRARLTEPAWIMLERCHHETPTNPQDEPCKFCGKTFSTWKKLTVHLAKHMENLALPVLALAQSVDVNANTVIAPLENIIERYPYPGGYPSPASTASPFSYADSSIYSAASSPYSVQYSAPQDSIMRLPLEQSRRFVSPHFGSRDWGFSMPRPVNNTPAAIRSSSHNMAPPQTYAAMDSAPNIRFPVAPSQYQSSAMLGSNMSASGFDLFPATASLQAFGGRDSLLMNSVSTTRSPVPDLDNAVADMSEALEESNLK
ncbi:hypothetical protein IFR05_001509 [Cadophora sp. M221]|nr:hypothetical protein IFR05_001509 [Cadophora sp. M221]